MGRYRVSAEVNSLEPVLLQLGDQAGRVAERVLGPVALREAKQS